MNIPIFETVKGTKIIDPEGVKAPPENPAYAPTFEYAPDEGLKTPMFEFVPGTKMTFPLGARTPPAHPDGVPFKGTVVNPCVTGLYTPTGTLDLFGTIITFPLGTRTPPKKPEVAATFVKVSVDGLKTPTFVVVCGIMTTFPSGVKTPPAHGFVRFVTGPNVENVRRAGLNRPIDPVVDEGTMTTFPCGVRTPPVNFPVVGTSVSPCWFHIPALDAF